MKIIIIIAVAWAVLGAAYFVYDTVENECRWSRDEGVDYRIALGGPLIWTLYGGIFCLSIIAN